MAHNCCYKTPRPELLLACSAAYALIGTLQHSTTHLRVQLHIISNSSIQRTSCLQLLQLLLDCHPCTATIITCVSGAPQALLSAPARTEAVMANASVSHIGHKGCKETEAHANHAAGAGLQAGLSPPRRASMFAQQRGGASTSSLLCCRRAGDTSRQ